MARIRIEIDTDDGPDVVVTEPAPLPPAPPAPAPRSTPRSPSHPSMREAEIITLPQGDAFDDDYDDDEEELPEGDGLTLVSEELTEIAHGMWQEIVAAQERMVDGLKEGVDGSLSEQRRNWIGGALASFAKFTGQNPVTLGEELGEMFPIETYQGRAIRRSHRTERPEAHAGATKRVDPTPEEIARLGVEVELTPEQMQAMDSLVVEESELEAHRRALREGNDNVFTDRD
jgi:hypothetical protein